VHLKATNEALLAVARGADHGTVKKALLIAQAKVEQWRPKAEPNPRTGELGLIDAFLGRKEEAIAECRRYMQEAEGDAFLRNDAAAYLAPVYARTGETDEAIKLIEKLLTLPAEHSDWQVTYITLADLKWQWVWDPIRNDPFPEDSGDPEPKTVY
jgi:tetratricopeptide (TPR) repeat protein